MHVAVACPEQRFCYQHIKDILASSGAYLRTGERKWFEFDGVLRRTAHGWKACLPPNRI